MTNRFGNAPRLESLSVYLLAVMCLTGCNSASLRSLAVWKSTGDGVATIEETGLSADMTRSTVEWQQRIGELALDPDTEDLAKLSQLLNERLR